MIVALYFSPTGGTRKVVEFVAARLADRFHADYRLQPYTTPADREQWMPIAPDDFVVWGSPVYAGRIPNKSLSWVKELLVGQGNRGVAVAVYGGRSYDNALVEMSELMSAGGIMPVADITVVARHVFDPEHLSPGRPNKDDFDRLATWCDDVPIDGGCPVVVPGDTALGYYRPLREDGLPANFLKAKPVVDLQKCNGCSICVSHCPMGSVVMEGNVPKTIGVCIKCHACIYACPQGALCFDDPDFLSHVGMLRTLIK